MRLDAEFVRLPVRVDAERLAAEISLVPEAAWRPHPQRHPGNSALPLISAGGDPDDDALLGRMRPTPVLGTCAYLQQVLAGLSSVLGRTRLMRLDGNAEAFSHADISYYWFDRTRVHIPVLTHPDVTFHCGSRLQHMAAGECWIFDTWRPHRVVNPRETRRIHLVVDTVGSAAFWALVDRGDRFGADTTVRGALQTIPFDPRLKPSLEYEAWNWPAIMPAAQFYAIVAQIQGALRQSDQAGQLAEKLITCAREWRNAWARHGDASNTLPVFRALREQFATELEAVSAGLTLQNETHAQRVVQELLLRAAVSPVPEDHARGAMPGKLVRPIFIVCPPRSGSSLLFETLAQSPDLWSIGAESHRTIESLPELHPAACNFDSNRLDASAASRSVVERLTAALWNELRDREGSAPNAGSAARVLEKTPKNALRVPFLAAAFPDALFVYLYRDPRETLSSMLDAWRSQRFVTYPELPGWEGPAWSLLLTPGWRELIGRPLHEIVATQWARATELLLQDLEALSPERWCVASYDRLLAEPRAEIERLCDFVGVRWDRDLSGALPLSRTTLTSPDPEKWRANAAELEAVVPLVRDVATRARSMFGTSPATRPTKLVTPPSAAREPPARPEVDVDFRSSYTQSFVPLLRQLGATLVVTTYQSGRVILVRADGDKLNTHLRSFASPMGIALAPGRLALGTLREVWEFFDMPALAAQLEPAGKHDAVYVPRSASITGDIRVHELAYAGDALWFVNTRFSTLCTLDRLHSFTPRWRPPFVSALAAEDRCHLNGMCVVDDEVRYVTAFGMTDARQAWRENKVAGGCILEVPSGRVVASGLCMPHSPRWHDGALWVLESGKGEIGVVDPATQRVVPRARLDGFTRGLAFAGPLAFVGLSQVRETQVFGGIPLTERAGERVCGVWVLDTRNGQTVAFLRFEGSVEEIFDVQVLHGARFAELLEPTSDLLATSYALSEEALAQVALSAPSDADARLPGTGV